MAAEAKGRKKALIENAKKLLLETDLPVEKIAKCCSLPLEQVISLKNELTKEDKKDQDIEGGSLPLRAHLGNDGVSRQNQ